MYSKQAKKHFKALVRKCITLVDYDNGKLDILDDEVELDSKIKKLKVLNDLHEALAKLCAEGESFLKQSNS